MNMNVKPIEGSGKLIYWSANYVKRHMSKI